MSSSSSKRSQQVFTFSNVWWKLILLNIQRRSRVARFYLLLIGIVVVVVVHRSLSSFASQITWIEHPLAHIERTCTSPSYSTLADESSTQQQQQQHSAQSKQVLDPHSICITTLTDEGHKSWAQRLMGWRNFDGVLPLTWQNKLNYVNKHGYRLFDESRYVDKSRPPAWSKILAVQRLLKEENCEWVLWLDADTVIMDSNKRMEEFLPQTNDSHSMLITIDDGGGYNSGAWILRNSAWSLKLLDDWWNLKSFVKVTGFSKCGDNHALKHLLAHTPDFDEHVLVPPRCTFNSFVTVVLPNKYDSTAANIKDDKKYMNEGYYHKGDFLVHLAGYDNKMGIAKTFLDLAV